MKTILVVDDEKNYLMVIEKLLTGEGYNVVTSDDPQKALKVFDDEQPQLVISDMKMPKMTGIELLKAVKQKRQDVTFIIMTAFGTVESAVEAMREGAFTYILKPFKNEDFKLTVKSALRLNDVVAEKSFLKKELSSRLGFEEIISESKAMESVKGLIEQVAKTKTTVLIHGESGTGKELVARSVHKLSPRAQEAFVAVNCGALTETLLESELFGHEKGAFTGALQKKKGRFEMADKGTLFLDEVSSMSEALQVKLLRALQEQTFERVGGTTPVKVDVRVIAASNRNLKDMVEKRTFREDLYYRLNVFTMDLPPLKSRKEDIMPLARHFLSLLSKDIGKNVEAFSPEAEKMLVDYAWPGNVRELRNVIERAVVVCRDNTISAGDVYIQSVLSPAAQDGQKTDLAHPLQEQVETFERRIIVAALESAGGVQAKAAKTLGISPATLQYKLSKYNIPH